MVTIAYSTHSNPTGKGDHALLRQNSPSSSASVVTVIVAIPWKTQNKTSFFAHAEIDPYIHEQIRMIKLLVVVVVGTYLVLCMMI